ncbi:DUF1707 SHOCT-like domain-containing protein [Microtetraspora fusca]|uniref:DUF1707 SHOCT-like domain-containing protein n=1 Tax=Microtetraspora fusca TaxID=1997 RepID=UPI000AF18F75|nr:DUF1707 domain-containing protein [Microtetraspora fusca]
MSLPTPMEPRDPKEMRVSHEDRDRVADALRVAAGDGRLTMEELDERLEAAFGARTYADLAPLLGDLPGLGSGALAALGESLSAPPVQSKDVVHVKRVGGSVRYEGVWIVPKRLDLDVRGGSVLLDFTRATVAGAMTEVNVHMRGGSLRIVVPPGYAVDGNEVSMHGGSVRDRSAKDAPPDAPIVHRIIVTGEIVGGSVVIRPPRRPGRLRRMLGRSAGHALG